MVEIVMMLMTGIDGHVGKPHTTGEYPLLWLVRLSLINF